MSHHDQLASNNLVKFYGARKIFCGEVLRIIVRGETPDAEIIQPLPYVLGFGISPAGIRGVELDVFLADLGHGADRAHEVLLQLVANRVKFQANRNVLALGRGGDNRRRCGNAEK
jgi:hypothetical protein